MRILLLTTSYAARGRGAAVRRLALAIADAGHDLTVIAPESAEPDPFVARVQEYPPVVPVKDRLAWTLQQNSALGAAATAHIRRVGTDVVHAVGWDVAWAAVGLKQTLGPPLVATVAEEVPIRDLTGEHRRIAREARAWLLREATPRGRSIPVRASARTVLAAYERAIASASRRRARRSVAAVVVDGAGSPA